MIQKDLKIKFIVVASGIFLAGVSKAMVCQNIRVISWEVGDHFRRTILSVGNSVDPLQAFINFTGHEPDPHDLLRELGLDK